MVGSAQRAARGHSGGGRVQLTGARPTSLVRPGELLQEAVTPSTTFYAASVTKQLIAALVAPAVLDGHLGIPRPAPVRTSW